MNTFILLVFWVLFYPSVINGQKVDLSFDTPLYGGTDDYYGHIGEDVVLTCTVPTTETRVFLYKGTSEWDYEVLVANGELVSESIGKYSLSSFDGKYQLTIRNLDEYDSIYYGCRICKYRTRRYRCHWLELWEIVVVYLDVKENYDSSYILDFCDLVDSTNGIFFTGNDIIMRCPKLSFQMTASDGSFAFTVNFKTANEEMYVNMIMIENLTEIFNGTMLSCFNVEDNSVDYCRHFPQIKVYKELSIRISPTERVITHGKTVNFTCFSYPFLPFTIEWNIVETDVLFGNVSESQLTQGIFITINDVEFQSSTSSLLVICNVTIGSENGIGIAWVYAERQDVTTQTTSPGPGIRSTKSSLGTTMTIKSDKFISPLYIAVPIIIVLIISGAIILGLVYIKIRKLGTSNEIDNQNRIRNQVVYNVKETAYDTRSNMNTKSDIGLTYHNSEVVDNVAYVPYNEGYKQY